MATPGPTSPCVPLLTIPTLLWIVLVAAPSPTTVLAQEAGGPSEASCIDCHGDAARLAEKRGEGAPSLERLLVDPDRFARSVHSDFDCSDCHDGFDEHPHAEGRETMSCVDCHDDQIENLAGSVHLPSADQEVSDWRAGCADCHGVHDVMRPADRDSRLHPLNVNRTCGQCHFEHRNTWHLRVDDILVEKYSNDAHARGLLKAGLIVSANCVSCHGGHGIRSLDDPDSVLSRHNVSATCGSCHLGALEDYRRSVHYRHGDDGATCTDCHAPHTMDVTRSIFASLATKACTRCHAERSSTYDATYHGKLSALGFGDRAAVCSDCHGTHVIQPASDPASTIHPDNLVATCAKCHSGSHAEFASYRVHADPHDAEANLGLSLVYRGMVGLLASVFVFFGLHSILWMIRSLIAGDWRRPRERRRARAEGAYIRRWPRYYSRLHVMMMFSFLALSITGLPLHYSKQEWAQGLMHSIGGPQVTSLVHRAAAVVMIFTVLLFFAVLVMRAVVKREKGLWAGPNTMVPQWSDLTDFVANLRWFLFGGKRPTFDRWTYWEKFDFWAVLWGMIIIGGSGVVLWFPEAVTRILPGWMINVSLIVHGHEALLAIGFIFTVHIFHNALRPDKLPMDTTFMTGRIPEDELRHERGREYDRLLASGRIESVRDRRPVLETRVWAYVVGAIALTLGILMVVAMIGALLSNRGH